MVLSLLFLVCCVAVCVFAYRDGTNNVEDKASGIALLFSLLFPIVGLIIYLINMKRVTDSIKYLKWAGIGFLVAIVCNLLLGV